MGTPPVYILRFFWLSAVIAPLHQGNPHKQSLEQQFQLMGWFNQA